MPVLRRDGILEEPKRLATLLRAELTTEQAETLDDARILCRRATALGFGQRDCGAIFPAGGGTRTGGKSHGSRVIYNVTHVTRYTYAATVELTNGILRLTPSTGGGQSWSDSDLKPIRLFIVSRAVRRHLGTRSLASGSRRRIESCRSPQYPAYTSIETPLQGTSRPLGERRGGGAQVASIFQRTALRCALSVSPRIDIQ